MFKKLLIIGAFSLVLTSCTTNRLLAIDGKNAARISENSPEGQYRIGMHYLLGRGVKQDNTEAMNLFMKSAASGYAYAQAEIGYMYASGKGVAKDLTISRDWYQKAADQNLASAQYTLGQMYSYGLGTPVNKILAREWYQKAADHGFRPAINALTTMPN